MTHKGAELRTRNMGESCVIRMFINRSPCVAAAGIEAECICVQHAFFGVVGKCALGLCRDPWAFCCCSLWAFVGCQGSRAHKFGSAAHRLSWPKPCGILVP